MVAEYDSMSTLKSHTIRDDVCFQWLHALILKLCYLQNHWYLILSMCFFL